MRFQGTEKQIVVLNKDATQILDQFSPSQPVTTAHHKAFLPNFKISFF